MIKPMPTWSNKVGALEVPGRVWSNGDELVDRIVLDRKCQLVLFPGPLAIASGEVARDQCCNRDELDYTHFVNGLSLYQHFSAFNLNTSPG